MEQPGTLVPSRCGVLVEVRSVSASKRTLIHPRKKAPAITGASLGAKHNERLVKLAGDAGERRVQLAAEAVHNGDDGNGDASGDQTILNGRRTQLVFHETRNKGLHRLAP